MKCPHCSEPLKLFKGRCAACKKKVDAMELLRDPALKLRPGVLPGWGTVRDSARDLLEGSVDRGNFKAAEEILKAMLDAARGKQHESAVLLSHYANLLAEAGKKKDADRVALRALSLLQSSGMAKWKPGADTRRAWAEKAAPSHENTAIEDSEQEHRLEGASKFRALLPNILIVGIFLVVLILLAPVLMAIHTAFFG